MVRSSSAKKSADKEGSARPSNTGELGSRAQALITGDCVAPEVLAGILTAEDIYISPQVLAAMTGLDEKWFAGAREGQKEVDGPPFKKLGTAKSSPIRYNLADVRKWWAQFPKQVSTHGKLSAFRSAGDFFKDPSPGSRWLFADVGGEPVDIVLALQGGAFDTLNQPEATWLTLPEWIARAWSSPRLHRQISVLLQPVQEAALAAHERHLFEVETRVVPAGEVRRLDDLPEQGSPDRSGVRQS